MAAHEIFESSEKGTHAPICAAHAPGDDPIIVLINHLKVAKPQPDVASIPESK
jgi:hypothetical protein